MGINSTEVSYGFGQMGSIHIGDQDVITSNLVTAGVGSEGVFVAITFIEDTVFNSGNQGLVADSQRPNLYPETTQVSSDVSSNGEVLDGVVFPAGLTIYGRWTKIKLTSGRIIAYVGY